MAKKKLKTDELGCIVALLCNNCYEHKRNKKDWKAFESFKNLIRNFVKKIYDL